METKTAEKRAYERTEFDWPICIWNPETSRFSHARSVNDSQGGALIFVGMCSRFRIGQEIEINFPRTKKMAKEKGQYARIKQARVLRIERGLLKGPGIFLAVKFTN